MQELPSAGGFADSEPSVSVTKGPRHGKGDDTDEDDASQDCFLRLPKIRCREFATALQSRCSVSSPTGACGRNGTRASEARTWPTEGFGRVVGFRAAGARTAGVSLRKTVSLANIAQAHNSFPMLFKLGRGRPVARGSGLGENRNRR
jgi:hypothetical protein